LSARATSSAGGEVMPQSRKQTLHRQARLVLETITHLRELLQLRTRVAVVAAEVEAFRLYDLLHCTIELTELGFGDVAPPCVIEVEVERDGERPAAAGEEHVGRQVDDELVAVEPEQLVDAA
jgi:hypothetical protein